MKNFYFILCALLLGNSALFAQDPCANISTITCGNTVQFSPQTGLGNASYPNNISCSGGSAQGGKEQIYQFTATVTGTYELNLLAANGGIVQYLYKNASLGCDNTGWICINRPTELGSIGSLNLSQGQTYYILLNSEVTTSVTQQFEIKCARVVCNDILPLTCNTPTTLGPILGFGDFDYKNNVSCPGGSGQGGKEQIYQFTAPETGTYELELLNASGGIIQYSYKNASLGCNNTGWFCISRHTTLGSIGSINLDQGQTYYILLNSEVTTSVTQQFQIKCARVLCNDIISANCGSAITFGPAVGFGDADYKNNMSCPGGSGQGGKEQIYYFPPSSSGYQFQVTAASGDIVQYMWKSASLGCNNADWNCLGRMSAAGLVPNSNLIPANTPIYLLLNSESPNSVTQVFNATCVLGTGEFKYLDKVLISPNPTTGIITFKNLPFSSSMSYEIFNNLGQKTQSGQLKNQPLKIDGQNGEYTLKIKDGVNEMTRKIILKK